MVRRSNCELTKTYSRPLQSNHLKMGEKDQPRLSTLQGTQPHTLTSQLFCYRLSSPVGQFATVIPVYDCIANYSIESYCIVNFCIVNYCIVNYGIVSYCIVNHFIVN